MTTELWRRRASKWRGTAITLVSKHIPCFNIPYTFHNAALKSFAISLTILLIKIFRLTTFLDLSFSIILAHNSLFFTEYFELLSL